MKDDMKDFEITIKAWRSGNTWVYQVRTYSLDEAADMAKDIIEEEIDSDADPRIVQIIEL